MDKKRSIINIQDLDLSAASRHSIGGQLILRVIYRKFSILKKFFFVFRKNLFLEKFKGYQQATDTLNESPEISVLSIIS
jgi:hypothetical protein